MAARPDLSKYRDDPVGYARDVLGVELWGPVADALRSLLVPPYLVSIDSGHGTGKSFGAAVAVNWWYDTRDPCWIITTAPTDRDVKDILWTEIRLQRQRAIVAARAQGRQPIPFDLQPAAAEMRSGPEHVAKGYTARDANSAQGRHRPNMFFAFDEKEGVISPFWDGMKSMFRPGSGDAGLFFGNPLTTTSRAYQEHKSVDTQGNPKYHRVRLSSIEHPNVVAGLQGLPPPIPGAVTVDQVDMWIADWCDPVAPGDERPTDITWKGRVFRPGPIGEPRILGLRPSAGTYGVWSEALFDLAARPLPDSPFPVPLPLPVVGCDVAQFGDDYTAIHTRCGGVSLRHQAGNGWDHLKIADRLRDEAAWCADWHNAQRDRHAAKWCAADIPINLDDDATGRAVTTVLSNNGFNVNPVNAGGSPVRADLYPNVRSELWFLARNKAAEGMLNLSRIDGMSRRRIEQQALAPEWTPDTAGRRVVEPKKVTKEKMGRSPDDMDAVNLAYYEPVVGIPELVERRGR